MLTISGLTYRIGGRHGRALFNEANAQIPEGSKLGLVGRNGAGKSTLLDLIRGRLLPDRGDIFLPRGHRIGFLAQEAPGGSASALGTVLAADRERTRLLAELDRDPAPLRIAEIEDRLDTIAARAAPARAARILAGLGLAAAMQAQPLSELSGGWRMRVALAAVLFAEPDLMLLDEPTNHLDLEAALWLENYLRRYRYSFVLVSHDRQLLNAATTTTLHLDSGKLTLYSGGFDQFLRTRREAAARQAALAQRQLRQRAHMQEFVDRFRYKASKARQAQSRMKALARLEPVALIADAAPPTLRLPQPPELSPPIISLEKVSTGYAPGRPVLSRLDLRLDPDDRIALLGANGNGKTTFARLLAGRLAPLSGRMIRSPKLTAGFFAQHQIEEMQPEASAYDDLDAYRRRLLDRDEASEDADGAAGGPDPRRAARRGGAERRLVLQPLRQTARQAEAAAARLAAEQRALDQKLAAPGAFGGQGAALTAALKRRAELARLITEAEAEWLAAETAIEQFGAGEAGR